jgi:hypothetical protein
MKSKLIFLWIIVRYPLVFIDFLSSLRKIYKMNNDIVFAAKKRARLFFQKNQPNPKALKETNYFQHGRHLNFSMKKATLSNTFIYNTKK